MISVTRRAVRTTAAIAGIAALGTSFAGSAAALPELPLGAAAGAVGAAQGALAGVGTPNVTVTPGLDQLPDVASVAALPQVSGLPDPGALLAQAEGALGPVADAPALAQSIVGQALSPIGGLGLGV